MALSHATYRGTVFVPGGFVGDRRTLRLPGAVRALHAAFFTALGWLILGGLFCLSLVIFALGISLAERLPALFSIPHSRAASVSRRAAFTRR
jgi:hypothetical protein